MIHLRRPLTTVARLSFSCRIHPSIGIPQHTLSLDNLQNHRSSQAAISFRGIATGSTSRLTFEPGKVEVLKSPDTIQGSIPSVKPEEIDLTNFLEPVETVAEVAKTAATQPGITDVALGVTSTDLGLTWWCPTGGLYNLLDAAYGYLPWWGCIGIATLLARLLLTPIVVYNQRNAAKLSHVLPKVMEAQMNVQKAMRIGNQMDLIRAIGEMEEVSKHTGKSFSRMFVGPLVQAPVFMTFFLTLRKMSEYPIFSMKTGGLWWFTDLTIADPYYILPTLTCATLWAVIKTGIEFGNAANPNQSPMVRNGMLYGLPIFTFAIVTWQGFPSALLLYWLTSNAISLGQVFLFNQPKIRTFLKIPPMKRWAKEELPQTQSKGFIDGFKEQMQTMKSTNDMIARARLTSAQNFERAGVGAPKKTFKEKPKISDD